MPKSGRAPRPPVEPRALQPYRTQRLNSAVKVAMDWVVCIATLTMIFFALIFSTKARHIISKTFAHKSVIHYFRRYRSPESTGYPVVSYGVPGHIWANSGSISAGEEKDEESERSEEFKYKPGENEKKVKQQTKSLQDVIDNDPTFSEEKFGQKTLEDQKEKSPAQGHENSQQIEDHTETLQFTKQTDDSSLEMNQDNQFYDEISRKPTNSILSRSDSIPS